MSESHGQPQYRSVNPADGQLLEEFPYATDDDVSTALAVSATAFSDWSRVPIEKRAEVVRRAAELFVERADLLATLATEEMGKLHSKGKGEAAFCGEIFTYFADRGPAFVADEPIETSSGARAVIQRRPIGPVLGVMPWNYPYYQVARFIAPNLVLGNVVLLKHAESVPRCALAIEELLRDAGLPEGVFINLFATHDQVATIIADPRVQGVSLTGSERAGSAIGMLAGTHLKKCVLELGGSDPYVILDTDDVSSAAALAWRKRMGNAGQTCNSNKRMIVMDTIYPGFVRELIELATGLTPGDPKEDTEGTFPPMASREAAEALAAQVEDAVEKGAVLHAGGHLSEGPDAYYSPAVLTGVTPEMRAYREELFGPVAVVYSVESDEEAIELANDSAYGLGGAVFSQDESRAARLAERLDVGMANVNTPAGEGADVPFGGVKRSGFGRELGPLGMDEFANKRLFYISD